MENEPSPPLCVYCPQQRSDADEATRIELRDEAVELQYGPHLGIDPSDITRILKNKEGVSQSSAYFAMDCLGKITRRNCPTCTISQTPNGPILSPRHPTT